MLDRVIVVVQGLTEWKTARADRWVEAAVRGSATSACRSLVSIACSFVSVDRSFDCAWEERKEIRRG